MLLSIHLKYVLDYNLVCLRKKGWLKNETEWKKKSRKEETRFLKGGDERRKLHKAPSTLDEHRRPGKE
ncbi:hypothetical protein VNO77_42522 [Canavalia gladiata]|uniref:Uncharacterized protein n=1 Tax=Canavalia gladiata TaxID=3824 RepID=A0AAN9PP41_CANGL